MRQLITLQLGSYANYVGAHFWNMQARRRLVQHACARVLPAACALSSSPAAYARGLKRRLLSPHQDEAAGLAEAPDDDGAAFSELDESVLYREAPSARGVRAPSAEHAAFRARRSAA